MWEFFSSAWALAIVPSAIAIAGVVAFAKTLLENRNLQLEKQRLQLEISAATRRVIIPSESQIEKYGVVRVAMHRRTSTVLVSGKGVGRFSGPAGAESVTRELVALLKPYRPSARN